MADLFNIVLIVTPYNTKEDMRSLWWVLLDIVESTPKRRDSVTITPPPMSYDTFSPSDAFWGEQTEVSLSRAEGRIACSTVVPYPPGVPVIYTGQRVTREQIDYILEIESAGGEINGLENGKIQVVK